ncbi:MAG: biopolymer transporter ExbD [Candidatus Omnitrophica bacterium]|nr:biopolymer transporter ExbD [Candidatus Omnitrophota bacterium]
MRFRRHIELEKGRLDIAPLIDVVFLLLIFFMLTSSFITQQGIKVNLPGTVSGKSLPREDLLILITDKNQVLVNDIKVTLERLKFKIGAAAKNKTHIMIKSDKEASLGKVVEIWDLCRDAGVTNINIATIHKEIERER